MQAVARELVPGYAYTLGYREGSALRGLRCTSGDGLPVMADRAHPAYIGSANHAGRGQNVLFVGGHVRWCVQPTVGAEGDHIYVNQEYRVGAGLSRVDSALGASDARPYQGE
jgi:prepilin-type processing-associated H-X9-DG protein